MQLTKNFTLQEMTVSQTATRHGLDNEPSGPEISELLGLCTGVLQPARDEFGSITVSSGFRGKELNTKIGGATTSQHCKGQAADIWASRVDRYALAKWIAENTEFDQLILEGFTRDNPKVGWVHVSHRKDGKNRKEILIADFTSGKVKYSDYSFT